MSDDTRKDQEQKEELTEKDLDKASGGAIRPADGHRPEEAHRPDGSKK